MSSYSLNRFDTTALGSMRFISLHTKTRALDLGLCYEALLGLLNTIDKEV